MRRFVLAHCLGAVFVQPLNPYGERFLACSQTAAALLGLIAFNRFESDVGHIIRVNPNQRERKGQILSQPNYKIVEA